MLINSFSLTNQQLNPLLVPGTQVPLDKVAVIILGGGEGKRLEPLTKSRCKPAVSFGGRYCLIDVPISHSLASGLNRIYVIGQYLANTLQQHLFQTYLHYGISQNQIQMLVPEDKTQEPVWYHGTADAIRKNLRYFKEIPAEYFLILSGDQLYNINFQEMIQFGFEKDAGLIIASQPVAQKQAQRMGLMQVNSHTGQVTDFYEKPQEDQLLKQFYLETQELKELGCQPKIGQHYLGSMGIYLFKRETLFQLLEEDAREDFGKHLITTQMQKKDVYAYLYDGYWEDIGTVDSYYHANLALTHPSSSRKEGLQCYDESSLIITKSRSLPAAQIQDCKIQDALICEGAIIHAKEIINSIIGIRSVIGQGTIVHNSILMGNEYYKQESVEATSQVSEPRIGKNCLISKAIIDENVTIGHGVKLVNQAGYQHYDSPDGRLFVRDYIIIIPRGIVIPDNYIF